MNKDDHKIHSEVVSSYLEVECIILIYRCIDIIYIMKEELKLYDSAENS